jgi:hypothetical protein
MTEMKIILKRTSLQLQLADHCVMGMPRQRKIVETRVNYLHYIFSLLCLNKFMNNASF